MGRSRSNRLINALIGELQAHETRPITGEEIAKRLRMRPTTLSKWRSGSTRLDQIEWLLRLLDYLPPERWSHDIQVILKRKSRSPKQRSRPHR